MKLLKISTCIIFPILVLIHCKAVGQTLEPTDPTSNKLIHAAKEIMASAGTCALISVDQEGRPRVRVMDPFPPENDFTIWFGTNPKSRKVDQIQKDPKVTLYYLDKDASGYVMVHGRAQIINDKDEKEKRWKDEWEAFYPNRSEGYILIKVSPEWLEVISYPRGILGDSITWEPPKVSFD